MIRRLSMDFQPNLIASFSLRKVDRSHWSGTVQPNVVARKRPVCSICGFVAETQRKLIHADEVWSFPEPPKVILTNVRPLCVYCHDSKDYTGLLRRIIQGKAKASLAATVMEHYCSVNQCSKDQFDEDVKAALTAQREIERRYSYGFNCKLAVDYGCWGRAADRPLLTMSEQRLIKLLFADRDEPIIVGTKSLTSHASAVKWLQSIPLDQRSDIIREMKDYVESEWDDDEVIVERDEGIQFS